MEEEKKQSKVLLPLLLSLVLATGVYLGTRINQSFLQKPFVSSGLKQFNKLNEVINYIRQEYVDTINEKQLVDKSINNILSQLDPHSVYIPAEELQSVNEPLEGNFDGIGVEFHMQNDTIMVVSPVSGGPSESVGIKSGDRIIKVEGKTVAGVHINSVDVMQKLRGVSGSKVHVTILRKGSQKLMNFTITRGKIPIYSIDAAFMVNKEVGYIKISRFAATTYDEYKQAFEKLKRQGLEKLILDLRDNPGGYLNAATRIADEFLEEKKLIVYTQGKARPKEMYYATAEGAFEKGKLVVLINEGSASASEILAGALQDLDRAVIVGRRSFGKGLVQEQTPFPDGSALRLTIARYYTPTGRCIQKSYKDGIEQYNEELFHRYKTGELENSDSIKIVDSLKFKTPAGKVVYGGGGIMPDIFVPLDTNGSSPYLISLVNRGVINQYAYDYVDENRAKIEAYKDFEKFNKDFQISDALFKKFQEYAIKSGIKKDSSANKFSTQIIKTHLKAYIARQVWKNEGLYPVMLSNDQAFKKALEVCTK